MLIELVALCTFYVAFPPFLFIVTLTLVLASVGQSLGVRRLYIDVLLKVFEVSRSFIVGSVVISSSMLATPRTPRSRSPIRMDSWWVMRYQTPSQMKVRIQSNNS